MIKYCTRATYLVWILLVLGCGATPKNEATKADPMVVLIGDHGHENLPDIFTADDLFQMAKKAYKNGEFEECVAAYEQLIRFFPDSKYTSTGYFNRGLCLQDQKKHALACKDFREYIRRAKKKTNQRDGKIRLGYNLVYDAKYSEALTLYDALLEGPNITGFQRAECLLRRGMAKAGLKDAAGADVDYERSLYETKQASHGLLKGSDLAAEALFRRGELYGQLMSEIKFKLPKERMRDDLRRKTRLFQKAQRSYTESINIQNAFWSTASGSRAGELFEFFYIALSEAEIPEHFTSEMKQYYHAEMNRQILPILAESIEIYELNLAMSLRLGITNDWVKKTESRLEKLRRLYEERKKHLDEHPTLKDPDGIVPIIPGNRSKRTNKI